MHKCAIMVQISAAITISHINQKFVIHIRCRL